MDAQVQEVASWLAAEWSKCLAGALEAMTGELPPLRCQPEPAPPDGDLFWWEQCLPSASNFLLWAGAPAAAWRDIGSRVLLAAGIADGDDQNLKNTYQEVLNQSLAGLALVMTNRVRKPIDCSEGRPGSPAAGERTCYQVSLKLGGEQCRLYLVLGAALLESLQPPAAKSKSSGGVVALKEPPPLPQAKSLDLLLDVELPVSVSFGRAQLPLRDVIKLTTGSIVELNRAVSEPVEIIVNNCVIARGQVVVVEGNFGVRIKQVISRQERLRTLK